MKKEKYHLLVCYDKYITIDEEIQNYGYHYERD